MYNEYICEIDMIWQCLVGRKAAERVNWKCNSSSHRIFTILGIRRVAQRQKSREKAFGDPEKLQRLASSGQTCMAGFRRR